MKKRNLLRCITTLLCTASIVASPIGAKAEGLIDESPIYYDTEQGRFVNNLDEYLSQMNHGIITPYASTIEEHESEISLYGTVSDPSKKCSNIFGHKWGEWTNWVEVSVTHYHPNGPCLLKMERTRKCNRTYCNATQTESDGVFIKSCR